MYEQYGDSSYFHNETGFQRASPFGDCADVLLSDAPGVCVCVYACVYVCAVTHARTTAWLLQRYPLIIAAGELAQQGVMCVLD